MFLKIFAKFSQNLSKWLRNLPKVFCAVLRISHIYLKFITFLKYSTGFSLNFHKKCFYYNLLRHFLYGDILHHILKLLCSLNILFQLLQNYSNFTQKFSKMFSKITTTM